jgi:hypothetical protein
MCQKFIMLFLISSKASLLNCFMRSVGQIWDEASWIWNQPFLFTCLYSYELCSKCAIVAPLVLAPTYWRWKSRDNAVGIATAYGLGDQGVRVWVLVAARIFFASSRPVLGPIQPPFQWVLGALSPGVKRPGREADHLPPTSAEVKKT